MKNINNRRIMLDKSAIIKRIAIPVLALFAFSALSQAQEEDPFYVDLLKKGELSFLAGNYKQAIKDLEIACFGLKKNKKLKAKTYVYLGLSYNYLQDETRGSKYFKEAEELLAQDGLNALDISEEVKNDLRRLSQGFQSERVVKPKGVQMLLPVPSEKMTENESVDKEQLEHIVNREPQKNIPVYYELYSLYRAQNKFQEAKKTVEELIENNPQEVFGYYLLGSILYQEGEFKKCAANFEEFFRLSANLDITHDILAQAISYLILSLYHCDERDRAEQLIGAARELLSRERLLNLQLNNEDKTVLQILLEKNN